MTSWRFTRNRTWNIGAILLSFILLNPSSRWPVNEVEICCLGEAYKPLASRCHLQFKCVFKGTREKPSVTSVSILREAYVIIWLPQNKRITCLECGNYKRNVKQWARLCLLTSYGAAAAEYSSFL